MGNKPRGIDWDQVGDLGKVPDSQIALRFGVSNATVCAARRRRGIGSFRLALGVVVPVKKVRKLRLSSTEEIDWDQVKGLGQEKDALIASRLGVSSTIVANARKKRGVPSPNPLSKPVIDWDRVPLGEMTDGHLADLLGCSKTLVFKERTKRKLPPYGMLYRTLENQGSYYEEAIIDSWLHSQGISHSFQKKIGPYRVDWLLDNSVVWEFAGMWDHQNFGAQYRDSFARKVAFLSKEGYSVRTIFRSEIPFFKEGIDLSKIISLGRFTCPLCERKVEHHAYGLCSRCYGRKSTNCTIPFKESSGRGVGYACSSCGSTERFKRAKGMCRKCYFKQRGSVCL